MKIIKNLCKRATALVLAGVIFSVSAISAGGGYILGLSRILLLFDGREFSYFFPNRQDFFLSRTFQRS